jgi:hypothetical protein
MIKDDDITALTTLVTCDAILASVIAIRDSYTYHIVSVHYDFVFMSIKPSSSGQR